MDGKMDDTWVARRLGIVRRYPDGHNRQRTYLPDILHNLVVLQETTAPYESLTGGSRGTFAYMLDSLFDLSDRPLLPDLDLE
jgi:hypothetical protein